MPMRVGFDLVSVAAVEDELRAPTRDRYLARVYTEREVAECTTDRGVSAERLAARFAAKEATIKVLPHSASGFALREIEARRTESGRVEIELTGAAASLASDGGILGLSVSLTHEAGIAGAVVIAEYRAPL
jgi:holo-[acyl-carrier protein] synthase